MNRIFLIDQLKKWEYKKKSVLEAARSVRVGGQALKVTIQKGSEEYKFEARPESLKVFLEMEEQAAENQIQETVNQLYPPEPARLPLDDSDTNVF